MARIALFHKVSAEQFAKDTRFSMKSAENILKSLPYPVRSTADSAGYDFHAPFPFCLIPGETVVIPLGIRCEIATGWVLMLFPRSSVGMKYKVQFDNTVGIIDADYYHAANEGHIMAAFTNHGNKIWEVNAGDRILQAIFLPFGITQDDNANGIRTGGMGSTGE